MKIFKVLISKINEIKKGFNLTDKGSRNTGTVLELTSSTIERRKRKTAIQKAYYQRNREEILVRAKKYRDANKEAIASRNKVYVAANREVIVQRKKDWYISKLTPEKRAAYYRKKAKQGPALD